MKRFILCIDSIGKIYIELLNIFQKDNIKVIKVENIEQAINMLNDINTFDLIIWTIYTEDEEIFKEMKKIKKISNTPSILISNYNNSRYIIKAIKAGATDYIVRPFDKKILINKFNNILNLKDKSIEFNDNDKHITFSLKNYLSMHIKGALRGKYEIFAYLLVLRNLTGSHINKVNNNILRLLQSKLRETDMVISIDNDKFLIIFPYTDKEKIQVIHKKIKSILSNSKILNKIARGSILLYSYEPLKNEYLNKEQLLLENLHSNLKICMSFSEYND